MIRAAEAYINLQALRHNFQRVRECAPDSHIMAIVKANGYGHGLTRVAGILSDTDAFGVANLHEAVALRDADITQPVVILQGVVDADELEEVSRGTLDIVVHHPGQVELLERTSLRRPVNVWLKVDTGMHRLGFAPERVEEAWGRLRRCPGVAELRLMTHLSDAEVRSGERTAQQMACFNAVAAAQSAARSVANSAAVLASPATHGDWVRPGLMLYGASPFSDTTASDEGLRPVMTLSTRLIAVNYFKKNDPIGYGGEWVCPEDMPVGVAAVGYGDGYPRHARSGTPVLVNNQSAALIGRVSMDMICLDLRGLPAARVNDPVVLWGEGLPVEVVARHAGTIPYDLLCGVSQRVRIKSDPV